MHGVTSAVCSFDTKARFEGFVNLPAALADVTGRMLHDAVLATRVLLGVVVGALLRPSLEKEVVTPALELVHPIQDVIDAIPVQGLQDMYNLQSMVRAGLG